MTDDPPRVVRASREIGAGPELIFELIADPALQPRWDGNDNLAAATDDQRVHGVGDVFTMTLTHDGAVRENHVVEFDEGRLIAWRPAEPGNEPPGHLWRWELQPVGPSRTRVTHTYDWSQLHDANRVRRAMATTESSLSASLAGLAGLAESWSRSEAERDRDAARARLDFLDALAASFDRRGEVLEVIANSASADDAVPEVMRLLNVSEFGARAILDLQWRRFARLERGRILAERDELRRSIGERDGW